MKTKLSLFMVAFALLFCSCEKNLFESDRTLSADKNKVENRSVTYMASKGDDDEPIVEGLVEDATSQPVIGADVVIIEDGQTVGLDTTQTDASGEFTFTVDSGDYFFEVYLNSVLQTTTNNMEINNDTSIVIQI